MKKIIVISLYILGACLLIIANDCRLNALILLVLIVGALGTYYLCNS